MGSLIAILLMAFTLLSYTHSFFTKRTNIVVNLVQAADQAIENSLSSDKADNTFIDLSHPSITTTVSQGYWGLFKKYTATASHQKSEFTKTLLIGSGSLKKRPALYLKDRERPLVLAGSAKITGDAYLPEKGLRTGQVAGNSYYHDQLLFGNRFNSSKELPSLESEQEKYLRSLTNYKPDLQMERLVPGQKTEFINSFNNSTQIIKGDYLLLEGLKLTGNIIIWASEKIVVTPRTHLMDVVLLAPDIEIQAGVKGSFQAIASNKIYVGSSVKLAYPTTLAVINRNFGGQLVNEGISIGEASEIRGILLFSAPVELASNQSQIYIDENTTVIGEIYNTHNLELKGQVSGSVTTTSFVAIEEGSIYQNHLYKGRIDAGSLPEQYAGLLTTNHSQNQIVKCLY